MPLSPELPAPCRQAVVRHARAVVARLGQPRLRPDIVRRAVRPPEQAAAPAGRDCAAFRNGSLDEDLAILVDHVGQRRRGKEGREQRNDRRLAHGATQTPARLRTRRRAASTTGELASRSFLRLYPITVWLCSRMNCGAYQARRDGRESRVL